MQIKYNIQKSKLVEFKKIEFFNFSKQNYQVAVINFTIFLYIYVFLIVKVCLEVFLFI